MSFQADFTDELAALGERVKKLREIKNLTQPQLGELVGMRISNISRIEHGHSNVKLLTIVRLSEAFKITLTTFFTKDIYPIRKKYQDVEERFEDEKKKLGARIEDLTTHRNLNQDELAVLAKIDAGDISRYINGESNIEFINILRIAKALEVTLFDLFDYKGEMPDNKEFKGKF